ncbi:unnamed protein product [Boreogadus saida]
MYKTSKKPAHQVLTFSSFSQGMLPARQKTWKRIFVGTKLSLKSTQPHFKSEDCDAFRDRSTHRNATSKILGVDAPGSSHVSSHSEELKILSVYGKGEGPLAVDGHDTLFTASKVEALNSLSADHSVAKSLERGERLVCREELSVRVGNHLLIHHPKERLPLLQLQNKPIESPHLYDSVNVFTLPIMSVLCPTNLSVVGIDIYSVKMKEYVLCVFPSYVESSRPQTPFQSRLKRILVEACPP